MADRLAPLDVTFLYLEEANTAMHVGGVLIFDPPEAPDTFYDRLVELISARLPHVPRYRQKVKWVPGHLANPVWVDDPEFDVTYHVRRSALPKPGTDAQLGELVGRLQGRQLDRTRPLWEMNLVEGLEGGRVALVSKTHHAMVDGASAIDIGSLLLDVSATTAEHPTDDWVAQPEPGRISLLTAALLEIAQSPVSLLDTARTAIVDARAVAGRLLGAAGGMFSAARTTMLSAPASPLNATIGPHRRYAMVATDLDDYKLIRKAHGGSINDVVLATVAGALRTWLLTRGEPVNPSTSVRVMAPMSVRNDEDTSASKVSSYFVDLPVGEPSSIMRLHQVTYAMRAHQESNQSVAADAIVGLAGFAPPTLHSLGARVASSLSSRVFNLVVTNVPGPQVPLYAVGTRMRAMYPVVPLVRGQAVCIGLTSYDGAVYYGLLADRDAMSDVEVLAACISEALAELVSTVR